MPDARRIVALTCRDDLRACLLRLAALAGAEIEVITGSASVRAIWRLAAVVVVGSDLAGAVAAAALPRRSEVVVVTTGEPDVAAWRSTVELGAEHLMILPADEARLVELMGDAVEGTASGGLTIAVIGGCGGAGASTFATALALTGVRTGPTILIDGDRFGGGLDVLLGAEQRPGTRWPDLAAARGRLGAAALADALPHVDGLALVSWDRTESAELAVDAAEAVINAAGRGFATVVVDLPRRFDPASTVLATAADTVVMLVPATVRGTAAGAMTAAALLTECPRLGLVVRDVRAGRLSAAEVADALGLPVVATLTSESAVAVAAERGEPPLRRPRGSLYEACRAVLAAAPMAAVGG